MTSIARQFSELYDKALVRFQNRKEDTADFPNLSANEEHYIDLLYGLGRTTMTDFARKADISKPAATRIIHNFLDKGFLIKTPSEIDKRVSYLELNGDLQEYSRQNFQLADTIFLEMLSVLTDEERQQLSYLIDKVNQAFW